MVAIGTESEVKMDAGVGFLLPEMDGVCDGVRVVDLPERRLTAVYIDTADLRLMRSGLTLRHRHERDASGEELQEWTLKLPMPSEGPMLVRHELRWEGPLGPVPAAVDSMVRAWRRSSPLETAARLVTVRQSRELRDDDGVRLGEIDDDVVSVMDGPRLAARFRQIEVEMQPHSPRRLVRAVVGLLEAAGARRGDDRAKVVRALGARAMEPPDVAPVELNGRSTFEEVVSAAIADCYLRMVRHDAGVRLDEDPESVHQARVATRRLRSDLRFLRRALDGPWVRATRDDLGWMADALGAVRDADVLTERLRLEAANLATEDSAATEELLELLAEGRAGARDALLAALDSDRYIVLLDRLAAAVADPPLSPVAEVPARFGSPSAEPSAGLPPADPRESAVGAEDAGDGAGDRGGDDDGGVVVGDLDAQGSPAAHPDVNQPAATSKARRVLPGLVARPWRHLAAAVDALGDPPADDDLHQVRIAAKRLRYACETAAPVCGPPARALGRAAADLQTVLGDLNDAVVASAWLRRTAAAGASPSVALVAGQLVARQAADAALARSAWPDAWKRLRSAKLRAWLHS